jgi:lipopolysaccharide export system protein LptA
MTLSGTGLTTTGRGLALLALVLAPTVALAQQGKSKATSPLAGFGAQGSKEPYKIDANRLEVKQTENKAIYSGDVVIVQGKMTMRCTSLVIVFDKKEGTDKKEGAEKKEAKGDATAPVPGASGLKRLECHGPVTVTQDSQTATSRLLVYEADVVTMTGNVVLSDGDNVQAGEKLVYRTKSGVGTMEGGRVRGIFTPGQKG